MDSLGIEPNECTENACFSWLFTRTGSTPEHLTQPYIRGATTNSLLNGNPTPATTSNDSNTNPSCTFDIDWLFKPSGYTPETVKHHDRIKVIHKRGYKSKGRKRLTDKFPRITKVVDSYVKQNGFEAHRRRKDIATCGSRVDDIRLHALKKLPSIRRSNTIFCKSSVGRLFQPPNRKYNASKYYKALIDARVAKKRNQKRKPDPDDHFYSSRVAAIRECATYFEDDCCVLSCDNKNKVNIGTLAVCRYIRIDKIYHIDDAPNYPDHDFPSTEGKIIPMGYMELVPKVRRKVYEDYLDRPYVEVPVSGPLHIINRSGKHHGSTMAEHADDLIKLRFILKGKKILILITDNGPDWTSRSSLNLLYYFRIWRTLKLDVLIVVSYCPYRSALNPIEHAWMPCTKAIVSLTLDDTLPNETVRPSLQKLSPEILHKKTTTVVDNAMIELCSKFNLATYDKFKVTSNFIPCNNVRSQNLKQRHASLKASLQNTKQLKQNASLHDEVELMMKHINRRWDAITFKKCSSTKCQYCTEYPEKSTEMLQFLNQNPGFPDAVKDSRYPGHYYKFLDYYNSKISANTCPDIESTRVQVLQRAMGGTIRCNMCEYTYTSKCDKIKHRQLFHSDSQ